MLSDNARRRTRPPDLEKRIEFRGSSLNDVRAFPDEARREAGHQLGQLQRGKDAADWKPMTAVGPGTIEVRIHAGGEHRVFVVCKFEEAIYVLHVFQKKTPQTSQHDIRFARRRYRDLIRERGTR